VYGGNWEIKLLKSLSDIFLFLFYTSIYPVLFLPCLLCFYVPSLSGVLWWGLSLCTQTALSPGTSI
jgi:hypothetical protein